MELPSHCQTNYRIRTRFCEVDLMGVVHHAAYVPWLEAARIEYLRRRGLTYSEMVEHGSHLAVVETHLVHKRPARFDEVIEVRVRLTEIGRVRAHFAYSVYSTGPNAELLAEGATVLASVNSEMKLSPFPAGLRELLIGPEVRGTEILS